MGLIIQTSIIMVAVIFADNPKSKRSFLIINRITKITFLGIQVIQLLRGQISFYNLLILSHIGGLLTMPSLVAQPPAVNVADFLDAGVHGVTLLINLYLVFVSIQREIASCAWPPYRFRPYGPPFATETTNIPRPDEWLRYTVRLMDLAMLDFIRLVDFGLRSFSRRYQPNVWTSIYEPALAIIFAAALTIRLETLVAELDKMMVSVSESLPISQLTAMFGLIVVAVAVWDYAKGKSATNHSILRYQLAWSQGKKEVLQRSKLT